jgi:molecular chaperone DnaK (HSP70)
LVPSATHALDRLRLRDRIGDWPLISRLFFIGRRALIGRPAVNENAARMRPNFAPSFKLPLMNEPTRPLARAGVHRYTARQVAGLFVRELLAEVHRVTGERIRNAVFTVPVDSYETYRAELGRICHALGIRRPRFLDEPVAAAMGYGLTLSATRAVLVVDFGGGTLHMALVVLDPRSAEAGHSRVLAKAARPLGGGTVDRWLLEEVGRRFGFPLKDEPLEEEESLFWYRQMLEEARRVKEAVFFHESAVFRLSPPLGLRRPVPGKTDLPMDVEITRTGLTDILRDNGLYQTLEECLEELEEQCRNQRLSLREAAEVLMIGGSTLLPGVYSLFENRFGRDRVRAWRPFQAAAFGACAFASGQLAPADFIIHDYAFVTHKIASHDPEYTVVVPGGTHFPTPMNFWKRRLVPTCAFGEAEALFKLVICEIGRGNGQGKMAWDASGRLHRLGGPDGEAKLVVPLNEADPSLGYLNPPHRPADRRPRLEVSFGVNADRWLCATVYDLLTRRSLMREEPVVRLL